MPSTYNSSQRNTAAQRRRNRNRNRSNNPMTQYAAPAVVTYNPMAQYSVTGGVDPDDPRYRNPNMDALAAMTGGAQHDPRPVRPSDAADSVVNNTHGGATTLIRGGKGKRPQLVTQMPNGELRSVIIKPGYTATRRNGKWQIIKKPNTVRTNTKPATSGTGRPTGGKASPIPEPPKLAMPAPINIAPPKLMAIPKWQDIEEDPGFENEIKGMYGSAFRRLSRLEAAAEAARNRVSDEITQYQQWLSGENEKRKTQTTAAYTAAQQGTTAARAAGAARQNVTNASLAAVTGANPDAAASGGVTAAQQQGAIAATANDDSANAQGQAAMLASMEADQAGRVNEARVGDMRLQANRDYLKTFNELRDIGVELDQQQAQAIYNEAVRRREANRQIKMANREGRSNYVQAYNQQQTTLTDFALNLIKLRNDRISTMNSIRQANFQNQSTRAQQEMDLLFKTMEAEQNAAGTNSTASVNSTRRTAMDTDTEAVGKFLTSDNVRFGTEMSPEDMQSNPQEAAGYLKDKLMSIRSMYPRADALAVYQLILANYGEGVANLLQRDIATLFPVSRGY